MKLLLSAAAILAIPALCQAAPLITKASSFAASTPAFGTIVTPIGTSAISTGLDFSFGNVEGVFSDPPNAFCGANSSGTCDLLSDVDARIVVQNTLTQGLTSYLYAEAGYAADGTLSLSAYDVGGNLLATVLNGSPLGANGRTTFAISRATADIASFRISGTDTYGVNEIRIDAPVAGVPEPGTWALMIAGFGFVGAAMRQRARVRFAF